MIFKTFDNDLDGLSNKLGFSKRTFAEWGRQVKQSFLDGENTVSGFKNAIKTAFAAPKEIGKINLIPETDFSSLFLYTRDSKDFFNRFNTDGSASVKTLTNFCNKLNVTDKNMRSYLIDCMQKQVPASYEGYCNWTNKAIESTKQMTLGAKAANVAMKALSVVGNMLAFALITKGIEIVATGIDNWVHRVEKANETMSEAVSSYGSAKSNLESINQELESQNAKIAELQSKDKLSYAEKGQLEELQDITKELALQQDIEERKANAASKEAAKKTVDAYNEQYGDYDISEDKVNYLLSTDRYGLSKDPENDISGNLAELQRTRKLRNQAQADYDKAVADGVDTTIYANELQQYVDLVDDYETSLDKSIGDLSNKQIALQVEYDKAVEKQTLGEVPLTTDETEIINTYEAISDTLRLIYQYTDQNKWNEMEIANIFHAKDIEKTKDELVEMAKSGELTPETIKGYTNLNEAIEDSELFLKNGQSAAEAFCAEICACAAALDENADNSPTTFTDAISQVQSLSGGLDQLGQIYANISSQDAFDWSSILNNSEFQAAFGNLGPAYEAFIRQVTSTPDDINACQKVFDDLVEAYLYQAKDADGNSWMQSLSEDTKDATVAFLEQKGVVTALAIVDQALLQKESALAESKKLHTQICSTLAQSVNSEAQAKQLAKLEAIDFDNITAAELDTLIREAEQLHLNSTALYNLKSEKLQAGRETLNLNDDINALLAMAKASGIAASATAKLVSLQAGYRAAKAAKNETAMRSIAAEMKREKKAIEAQITTFRLTDTNTSDTSSDYAPSNTAADASDNAISETKETFDWLETLLSRLASGFDKLKAKGESTWLSFTTRVHAYGAALQNVTSQINAQKNAYETYMAKADSVGLSAEWISKIQSGASSIEDISNETLKQQINDYKTWYDKANSCKDKLEELKKVQTELTQAKLETVLTKYDKLAAKVSNINDRISNNISRKETLGGTAKIKDYTDMNKNISTQIRFINRQNSSLKKLQNTVVKGSQTWYEYNERIQSNNASLQDLKRQMVENAKAAAALSKAAADKKINRYHEKDELYDAKIENSVTTSFKNRLIDKKLSNIDRSQKAYDTAVKTDSANLRASRKTLSGFSRTKENKSVLKAVQKYAKAGKRIPQTVLTKAYALNDNGKLYNACVQYNAYYDAMQSDKAAAELYAQTGKQEKARLALEKFNAAADSYDHKISANEQAKTSINNQISLANTQGKKVSASSYESLISAEEAERQTLLKKREALQKSMRAAVANGSVKEGSKEWYSMADAIREVTNAIDSSTQSLAEYHNTIRQLNWDHFDEAMETSKRFHSEADFYINLMNNQDFVDKETGDLTQYGNAALSLYQSDMDTYLAEADAYKKEYDSLMAQIADGRESLEDETIVKRLRELQDAQRDSILSAENEKQAIADLVRKGYETQLDALSRLISKYKDLKNSEKDAYDYQRQISEKTKNIASLQKQLASYGANDTEESRAQIQKLRVELEKAREDLRDTEYQRYLSDSGEMLDELYNNYEEFIDDKLSGTDTILNSIHASIDSASEDILTALSALSSSSTVNQTPAAAGIEIYDQLLAHYQMTSQPSIGNPDTLLKKLPLSEPKAAAGEILVSIDTVNLPNVTNYEEFRTQLIQDRRFEQAVQSVTIDRINGGNSLSKYIYQ